MKRYLKPALGSLPLGAALLVGRKGTIPVAIEDVAQVYEYEHRTNFMVDHRAVIVLTKSGEKRQLCSFPIKDVSREDKLLLFAAIKQKNPNVKLGYK